MSTWIDVPVQDIIGFFTDTIGYFTMVALKMGKIIALLGVGWSLIQMALGTMEGRKFFVGTLSKFIFFFVIMTFYPSAVAGLRHFAIALGKEASPMALNTITTDLADYMKGLERVINDEEGDLRSQIAKHQKIIDDAVAEQTNKSIKWSNTDRTTADYYDSTRQKEQLQKQLSKIDETTAGVRKKIEAIKAVLKPASTTGTTNIATRYYLDLDMKNVAGKSLGYISPNALLRLTVLAAEILYENEWINDVVFNSLSKREQKKVLKDDDSQADFEREVRLGKKELSLIHLPVAALMRMLFVIICCLFMLITSVGCMIQYVMAIIEYFISSSVGLVIVPCMLFDGLNDMAQKVLPMLLAQALKLTMITMCMMFNVYTYLKMMMTVVEGHTAFGFTQFTYILFTSFLTFVLVVNAPKLATTILTGQPQMSMGEFMQAAGAIAAGYRGADYAFHTGANALSGTLRFGANRAGDLWAMGGAAKRGWNAEGGGALGAAHAFGSAIGEMGSRTGKRIRAGVSNFVHNGVGHGGRGRGYGGGGSGGGTADIMSAGNQDKVNAQNLGSSDSNVNGLSNIRDANNNPIKEKDQNPAAIGAMNYADARTNSGNNMGFIDYLKTQYNTAAGKEAKSLDFRPLSKHEYYNKDGIPVFKRYTKILPENQGPAQPPRWQQRKKELDDYDY